MYLVTVIICTHNPRPTYISNVIQSLKRQTLSPDKWELLLIDNASKTHLSSEIDLSWHPNTRHVREDKLGLTAARLRGIKESQNNILVFVDDDNVLDANYLRNTIEILEKYPNLGAIGGKSLPDYEVVPAPWIEQFSTCLALRDLGNEPRIYFRQNVTESEDYGYPSFAPIGAGLVIQKEVAEAYAQLVIQNQTRLSFGRTGNKLISGEDNDIILTLLETGWGVGYFPQLQLTHLISANRLTKEYLAHLSYASSCSWVKVLDCHNIRPWKPISQWSVLPRQIRAFLTYQAWKSPSNFIKWRGACGIFDGRASLSKT